MGNTETFSLKEENKVLKDQILLYALELGLTLDDTKKDYENLLKKYQQNNKVNCNNEQTIADEIKEYIFVNKLALNNAQEILDFINENTGEGSTIFHYTGEISIQYLKEKTKHLKNINEFLIILNRVLESSILKRLMSKEHFTIDIVTLTLESIIKYMK